MCYIEYAGHNASLVRQEQPMMSVWSCRPSFLHLGLFFLAYVLGCGFADALAIVPGITVAIWPPAGVFIATLILTSKYTWPWWIVSGCLAEMFAQFVWYHSPLAAGLLIYGGNALCAVVGALLVNWACGRPLRLETLSEVLAFVGFGAGVAPLVSATVGSAALAWFGVKSQTFTSVWPLFWIGDATGILLVGPLALVVIQQWHRRATLPAQKWAEATLLALIFLGLAALSLSTDYLASAYVIMPPLLWAAARFELKGVAVALTLLALITAALTISGDSHFVGDAETQREKQVMLQLFLAISAFSALIVAAISRQNQQALVSLREREQELSQLVDMVPVHIRRMTPEGEPIFFNKRLLDFFGLDDLNAFDKPGGSRLSTIIQSLVHPEDAAALLATARHSFATGEAFAMKYRMKRADGAYRWVDGRGEPLRDQRGRSFSGM
jgi:PAS domain S-box-containing protein